MGYESFTYKRKCRQLPRQWPPRRSPDLVRTVTSPLTRILHTTETPKCQTFSRWTMCRHPQNIENNSINQRSLLYIVTGVGEGRTKTMEYDLLVWPRVGAWSDRRCVSARPAEKFKTSVFGTSGPLLPAVVHWSRRQMFWISLWFHRKMLGFLGEKFSYK